jgi:hypothetical protein
MNLQWAYYQNAVGVAENPVSTSRYQSTSSVQGKTGFVDLVPPRPDIQARYDAMSPEWEGVSPTNRAMIQGMFSSGPAEIDKSLPERK